MDHKRAFYEVLDGFLSKEPWQYLKDNRFVVVEIPETKEMYYITIDIFDKAEGLFAILLMKGDLGLNDITLSLDEQLKPLDYHYRSHYICIEFEDDYENFSPEYFGGFEDHGYENYKKLGHPVSFYQAKGHATQQIPDEMISDLTIVLEVLTEQSLKNLKKFKRVTKKTTFETYFKTDGTWQKEKRKVKINYEKATYSQLEIYPVLQKTQIIDKSWYIVSIYEDTYVEDEELMATVGAYANEAGVYILNGLGLPMNDLSFTGGTREISKAKAIILDTLKTYEVRPKEMVISLKSLYLGLKDFLKALGIESVYRPGDPLITAFVEDFLTIDANEIFKADEIFAQNTLRHFFEAKGIKEEALDDMPDAAVESLMDEFKDISSEVMAALDHYLMKRKDLHELSEKEMTVFMEDYIIKEIIKRTKV